MTTLYCSLAEAKRELKAQLTVDDSKLLWKIAQVSRRLDLLMANSTRRPVFAPYIEERQVRVSAANINSHENTLALNSYLLALSAVDANGSVVTSSVEVFPPPFSPYQQLRYTSYQNTWYGLCSSATSNVGFVKVTGTWGYNADFANAFITYDDVTTTAVTPAATTITVADADGLDPFGLTPRFSPGQLLQIETEWLEVTAVNTVTNALMVQRAVNGSSLPAGNYAIGTDVKVYQVDENVKRATSRQAALLYAREGAFQIETLDGVGSISYPQDLLSELLGIIQGLQYA